MTPSPVDQSIPRECLVNGAPLRLPIRKQGYRFEAASIGWAVTFNVKVLAMAS